MLLVVLPSFINIHFIPNVTLLMLRRRMGKSKPKVLSFRSGANHDILSSLACISHIDFFSAFFRHGFQLLDPPRVSLHGRRGGRQEALLVEFSVLHEVSGVEEAFDEALSIVGLGDLLLHDGGEVSRTGADLVLAGLHQLHEVLVRSRWFDGGGRHEQECS